MTLAGLFSHRPIAPTVAYSAFEDNAHSALATLAGLSITIALLWHGLQTNAGIQRTITLALAFLCIALPLCMLGFPEYLGVVQRLMYLIVFVWLWFKFPRSMPTL